MSYLKSIFSIKKIAYKGVSPFAVWDEKTIFNKSSQVLSFAKLLNVTLGRYSRVGYNCNIAHTKIGNFSAIGRNCNIGLGQHPICYISTRNLFYKKEQINPHWAQKIDFLEHKEIEIGHDVWIGINSIIMDGIKIGNGAIIGAGSIVTKDVPPYSIVVGVPAKIVKYRFDKDIIEHLEKLKWWDFDDEKINRNLWIFNKANFSIEDINNIS